MNTVNLVLPILLTNMAAADAVCALERGGGQRLPTTERAYERRWQRWQDGERWDDAPPATRVFALAGVRWGAMRDLRAVRERLHDAVEAGREAEARELAEQVERLIGVLAAIPRDRPGRRGRPVQEHMASAPETRA